MIWRVSEPRLNKPCESESAIVLPEFIRSALVFASQFHRPLSLFLPVVFAGDCLEWRRELPQYPISEQGVLLSHTFYLLPPPRQQQEWASSLKHCRCNSCSVLAIASFCHRYVTLFLILELASWKVLPYALCNASGIIHHPAGTSPTIHHFSPPTSPPSIPDFPAQSVTILPLPRSVVSYLSLFSNLPPRHGAIFPTRSTFC